MIKNLALHDHDALIKLVKTTYLFSDSEIQHISESFQMNLHNALWFGAFENEAMLGVAYCIPVEMADKAWNILMLLVDPSAHRKGVGQGLMRKMEQTLNSQQQRLLLVETSSTDDFIGARHFYKNIGYTEQGAVNDFYSDGDHKITFVKRLSVL